MKRQLKIWTAAMTVSISLLVTGCGKDDKTEKDASAASSKTADDADKKEETIVQPGKTSQNTAKDKSAENTETNKLSPAAGQEADVNAEEKAQNNNTDSSAESPEEAPDTNDSNEDALTDSEAASDTENPEKDTIQTCGFVVGTDPEAQTIMIAEGWEEAPPSVIEARKTGVSYYIGDAIINCPGRIMVGLVVYLTYYTENDVNIATEITSDGDEKEPRFYDYEYPEEQQQ